MRKHVSADKRERGPSSIRKILFLGHTAGRNGAPIELLHFLRFYKQNGGRPFSILVDEGGELVQEYKKLGDTWAADSSHWCPGGIRSRILTRARLGRLARAAEAADVRKFFVRSSPALVYANSVAFGTARFFDLLDPATPLLTHVHELEYLLNFQGGALLPRILARTQRFIACSDAVRHNLMTRHSVPADRIETVHESIPVQEVRAVRTRAEILRELRLPDDALIVAGCGSAHWVKGPDLFIQLARTVCRERDRVYFIWVGHVSPEDLTRFEHDLLRAGVKERVQFIGSVSEPADYLSASDVFVLTSREDSYPLVCLEAAALGKSIVCFADAGGISEFVEDDCGFVVPYLDIPAMAERVLCLLDSSACRSKMGEAARRKVAARHDVSMAAPKIAEIIEKTIAEARV